MCVQSIFYSQHKLYKRNTVMKDKVDVAADEAATVADVEAATVADVEAATVVDVEAATVADVEAATVVDVEAATVADVEAATVADVEAATVVDVEAATVAVVCTICDVTTLPFKGWTPLKLLVVRTEALASLKRTVVLKRLICLEK